MKTIERYVCEICQTGYDTAAAAQACEARGLDPIIVLVGDIVFTKAGFAWFDGDPRWISNPTVRDHNNRKHGNCFGSCCTYEFYYVVTAIDVDDRDKHRRRYHVMTKAMANGHYGGWTYANGHYTPRRIERPPVDVVADSKDLIGKLAGHLL